MTRIESCLRAGVNCMNRFHLLVVGICLSGILMAFAPVAPGQMMERVLYQFAGDSTGSVSSLIRDSAGNLYGTTFDGGTAGVGTVFKVDPTGIQTVLYNFTGTNGDGAHPQGGLIMDSLGNLYGTTPDGGGGEAGIVFKVDPTGKETILYTFNPFVNQAAGTNPQAGLIMDSAGNLYGTAAGGGTGSCNAPNILEGCGVIFKLDPTGKETVLLSFTGSADGGNPLGGLLMDSLGNLYGTTSTGGAGNAGTVFKLNPTSHETVLHAFAGTSGDGAHPQAALVMDSAGNLYGTTPTGGTAGKGTVFKVTSTGQETVLHSFTGTAGDGAYPQAALTMDSTGNLYGTTVNGGTESSGIIFKIDATGNETTTYTFTGENGDGAQPQSSLLRDGAGNLYGTTWLGGTAGGGTIFRLNPANQETVLYSFTGRNGDGGFSVAGLTIDSAGNLYGTASQGGTSTNGTSSGRAGDGIVFKLDPTGKETVLHSFNGENGAAPQTGLIQDSAGNLYGTTHSGGHLTGPVCSPAGCGTIFKMSTTGAETVLYRFLGTADGGSPQADLVQDNEGNLYGATTSGGPGNCGTLFKLTANGQFRTFTAARCGSSAGLLRDSAGNLYGTMDDEVFKLDSKGNLTVLYTFTGTNGDGASPQGDLTMDSAGNLYGATSVGGTGCSSPFGFSGCGTVFKLDPAGHETVLYRFTGTNGDGAKPAGVIMDSAGNLYGTTYIGGTANLGTVFKVDPTGHETVLYRFTGINGDGANPQAGLVMDSAGRLYGTTAGGGKNNSCVVLQFGAPSLGGCGTVFVLTP